MLGLVLCGETQVLEAEHPELCTGGSDINVCSARPHGQLQLWRTRYDIVAVHPAGIQEPGRNRRPDTKVSSVGAWSSS